MPTRALHNDTPLLIGLGLIAVGIVALADRFIDVNSADLKDALVFGGFAALLLIALIATRGYGFLIAALAFAGLSAAKYAVMLGEDSGGAVLLGPGAGFLAAYAIVTLAFGRRHWWPLVPERDAGHPRWKAPAVCRPGPSERHAGVGQKALLVGFGLMTFPL